MKFPQRILYLILAGASLLLVYFGAAQPFFKMYYFTRVASGFEKDYLYRSFVEGEERALTFSSPVGQEEVTYFLGYQTLSLLEDSIREEVARALVQYYESWILSREKLAGGMFYTQGFSVMGQLYERLWVLYGGRGDFEKAEYYYSEGLRLAPDKPDFLYDLFRLYAGDAVSASKVKNVGEKILGLWPEDRRVREYLESSDESQQ